MGKRLVTLILAVALCLVLCMPAAMASASTSTVVLPDTMSGLNVRSGPGTSYSVAGWAIDGDEIELVKVGSKWTKITVLRSGKTGYINNGYIKDLPKTTQKGTASSTATAGKVAGKAVNMRKGAGTGYAKVATLASGTKLKIWKSSGNWHYVTTLAGKSGWVSKSYVSSGYSMTTSAKVNLRASANGKVIKSLAKGTAVNVLSITGNWSKVKAGSTTGYVYNQYLR